MQEASNNQFVWLKQEPYSGKNPRLISTFLTVTTLQNKPCQKYRMSFSTNN